MDDVKHKYYWRCQRCDHSGYVEVTKEEAAQGLGLNLSQHVSEAHHHEKTKHPFSNEPECPGDDVVVTIGPDDLHSALASSSLKGWPLRCLSDVQLNGRRIGTSVRDRMMMIDELLRRKEGFETDVRIVRRWLGERGLLDVHEDAEKWDPLTDDPDLK